MYKMMKDSPKIHALIVAAGKGTRFGAECPKQYLRIADQTVLEHSVMSLCDQRIGDLTLVHAADDAYLSPILSSLTATYHASINTAIGGAERWQSVQSGLQSIQNLGASLDDWVLIHDAARPCLPKADLAAVIDVIARIDAGGEKGDAAILASPVVDTLKFAVDSMIDHTVSREHLWQALTPQVFRLGVLMDVLDQVAKLGLMITDEASAYERFDKQVRIVSASKMNMKLTYTDDLPLLEMIIRHQKTISG